ncbi:mitochondrial ribonuclease P protein 1 homolog isoform X2 [Panonychus citri]|uniref:mitochondrial ribonuclease P protein 1 homolog isoform X2 n=1 Tax=Panonychus citri TaxID=50023 RepID=UPI002306DDDB|nr:mitochondrial ribonuclease P protein 1 homolog isoform X2 [Panonychus citri]
MRFKLFSAQSPSSFNLVYKKNLFQYSGLQANPSRSSSSSCDLSRKTLSSILFSNSKFKSNLSSFRVYCKTIDYDKEEIYENVTYEDLTVDMFKELIKTDEDAKQIEQILASYTVAKYETGKVPTTLTLENMSKLLQMNFYKREQYFLTLFNRELSKYLRQKTARPLPERHPHLEIERNAGKQQIMGVRFDSETGAPLYGEWLNSHFLRFRKAELTHSVDSNLISGYMFGPKIVIDCDYDLNIVEAKKVVWDINYTIKAISKQTDPFNLLLTGPINSSYKNMLNELLDSSNPKFGYIGLQMKDEHFLDLFPKEKIIYLSPYSVNPLKSYDKDSIYVLGGLPDLQSVNIRLGSLKKIKALGLKSYRLPLDDHFVFKASKRLSCQECVNILDHLSINNNLAAALKHGVSPGRYRTEEEIKVAADERTVRILKRSFRDLRSELENTKFT